MVAADSDTVSGKKASFVFVDELHEFGKQPKASNMLLEATGGLASRPEGFVIYATTQSAEPPAGVFKAKLDYARKVRDGLVPDRKFLPLIYEFPKAMIESGAYWPSAVMCDPPTNLRKEHKPQLKGVSSAPVQALRGTPRQLHTLRSPSDLK